MNADDFYVLKVMHYMKKLCYTMVLTFSKIKNIIY